MKHSSLNPYVCPSEYAQVNNFCYKSGEQGLGNQMPQIDHLHDFFKVSL